MYEMGYTFEEVSKMTLEQLNFLIEGIKWVKKEEAEAMRKAGAKARVRRRR